MCYVYKHNIINRDELFNIFVAEENRAPWVEAYENIRQTCFLQNSRVVTDDLGNVNMIDLAVDDRYYKSLYPYPVIINNLYKLYLRNGGTTTQASICDFSYRCDSSMFDKNGILKR